MAKKTSILPEQHAPDDVVGQVQPDSAVAAKPRPRPPKRAPVEDREPRMVVALCDLFDGIRFYRRGDTFAWKGPIPKALEQRLAPEGTSIDDDGGAPGAPAPKHRGLHRPQPWTTQGHPDVIAQRGLVD